MSAALTVVQDRALVADVGRRSVAEVLSHVAAVQEVMQAVMKTDVHFGKIPGTPKPTLYKQGAEVLCLAFKIGPKYTTETLSEAGVVRYRVTCTGIHQPTGMVMGEGIGECSSDEEKYRWRKAVAAQEFDATPEHMRRTKWKRGKDGAYSENQVRTEPADVANTILKMAAKRAHVAMVLAVTAASDMFSQDLEDLEENLRQHLTEDGAQKPEQKPAGPQPWPADAFAKWLTGPAQKAIDKGAKHDDVLAFAKGKGTLTPEQEAAIRALKPVPKTEAPAPAPAAREREPGEDDEPIGDDQGGGK